MGKIPRKPGRNSGFTLIELVIVIFIVLLITSATVPRMRTFAESTKLRSSARSIRNLLEFARNSSVTQRTEYVVLFDSNQQEYWLSLLSFLNQSSGQVTSDASRTSLSESLAALSNADSDTLSEESDENTEKTASRTGEILGIPKQLPSGVQILQVVSPRSLEGSGSTGVDYVTFHPDGTAEDFEVYLQSQSGKIFLVSVSKSTGGSSVRQLTSQEIEELGLDSDER